MTLQVTIDTRETHRIKSATSYYKGEGLTVEVKELPIGDYIFTNGEDSVVFEFKLISDFIASIQDGRVFNQSIEQSENFNHHFIIIHGDLATRSKCIAMTRNYRQVTIFQYLSAIASLDKYTTVIETFSPYLEESYYRMMIHAKKCLINKPTIKRFPRKHKNTAFNFLCYTIYGINYKKAQAITEAYDLKNLSDLQELTMEKLLQVEGIGEKNAERIITAIHGDAYD